MTDSSTTPRQDPPLDANGRIVADVACRKCEYSLRGLPLDATCPECGTAVRWSIYGDRLLYANPAWSRRLANGVTWVLVATLVFMAVALGGVIVDQLTGSSTEHVGVLAASLVALVGYWLVTTPEPGRVEDSPIWNVRTATRVLALLGAVAPVLAFFRFVVFPPTAAQPAGWLSVVAAFPLELAGYASGVLFCLLLYRLAVRIPNARLARQTQIVMWGLGSCFGLLVVVVAILTLTLLLTGSTIMVSPDGSIVVDPRLEMSTVQAFAGCGAALGLVVFAIWSIVLLFRYRAVLFAVSDAASKTWKSHVAGEAESAAT